jgi:hypothetical protein
MARFCFNANRKDAMDFLKTFYNRVDVDFEIDQNKSNESCIILKDRRDKDIFMNLNERLACVEGFSQPSYVPKWRMIRHRGPYLVQYEKDPYLGSILMDKTGKRYKLSPEAEKAAFLYAALITSPINEQYKNDSIFIENYWKDLKTYMGENQPFAKFTDIDWKDVVSNYRKKCKMTTNDNKKYRHGLIEVDGQIYTATPFAADDMSIFFGEDCHTGSYEDMRRGCIKRAINASDVTLNLSSGARDLPNISEFKEVVYKPGMKWAAKWKQPITGIVKYMDILFSNPNEEEFIENFIEMYDSDIEDSDEEGEERDYGEEGGENSIGEEDLFGDIGDLSDDDDSFDRLSEVERKRMAAAYAESIPTEELLEFDDLDYEEMDLPFSYIVPPKTQWGYALDACKSNFKVVGHLGKVNNTILQLVADAAAMALRNGTACSSDVNNAFIEYAEQRHV